MSRRVATFAALLLLAGCDETGRERARVALEARGVGATSFVEAGFTITITRADVAFGPAYLCATRGSSTELCEVAVIETTVAHPFDALDPAAQPLGELLGLTGTIRTAQYDLGIAFLLPDTEPRPLPGAIDGHSVVLEGTATDGVTTIDFVVDVDVVAKVSGNTAIVGARVDGTIPAAGATLTVGAEPARWLAGLDWAQITALPHAPGAPVVIASGTAAHDTILRAITTNAPLSLSVTAP